MDAKYDKITKEGQAITSFMQKNQSNSISTEVFSINIKFLKIIFQ